MMHMYNVVQAEMDEGNMDSLPELHATSAGLKAFSTEVASQGVEVHTQALCWLGREFLVSTVASSSFFNSISVLDVNAQVRYDAFLVEVGSKC